VFGIALRTVSALLLTAALLLPARYLNGLYGWLPCLLALFLFGLSTAALLLYGRAMASFCGVTSLICTRGDLVTVPLGVSNSSRLICPRARVHTYLAAKYGLPDTENAADFAIDAKSTLDFHIDVMMKHAGVYEVGLRRLEVSDPLDLLRVRPRTGGSCEVVVLPRRLEAATTLLSEELFTENIEARLAMVNDGYDYTGIRDYVPGDPMKRVHWKISAHTGKLMTRINEAGRHSELIVAIDLAAAGCDKARLPGIYDRLLEGALALAEQAERMELDCSLLFPAPDGAIQLISPDEYRDRAALVRRIPRLFDPESGEIPDAAGLLTARRFGRGSNIALFTGRVTDQVLLEITALGRAGCRPMLCCVLPAGINEREKEALGARLNGLGEYNIPWYLSEAED
jgi:uncharacterized protein (DUF58 family)